MTTKPSITRLACGLLLTAAGMAAGCSADPETTARKYAKSGDTYVAQRQHKEAIIEYRNALKAAPNAADLRYKLGRAYEESGDLVNAYMEFVRAADLDPSNVDAQMRAGTLLLAAREFAAARTRAELALKADPVHAPAHILLGNAMAGLNETGSALRQIEQAISVDPSYAPAWTALGAVNFIGGRKAEASQAFEKAVALSPKSVDARLALANYQWANSRTAEAETTLKTALELEPGNSAAHRALALLYVTTRRAPEAEAHFKALANDVQGKLALADYYMGIGRNSDALTLLGELEKSDEKTDARAASLRIAAINYSAGKKAEAHGIVDGLIRERPRYAEARTAKARMLLADGAPSAEALTQAREAVKADPDLPAAQYTLGLAALAARSVDEAERAFEEAARISPSAAAAHVQLARLRLARGETAAAAAAAELAARERPGDAQAAVLLVQSLRAQGQFDRAGRELSRRLAAHPDSAPLHLEMGWLSLERREPSVARASFQEALRRAPQSLDARAGIIAADLADRKVDAARTQVAEWRKAAPADDRLRVLAAKVELAAGNFTGAEQTLKDVIAADPSHLDAYELLGRAYITQNKIDQAVQQYEALVQRSPAVTAGAKTMIGMLHEARSDRAAARASYEEALGADPKSAVAANNLAWMYAEEGRLDEALKLATTARDGLRRRPEGEDTVGWVYLRKGLTSQAIASFERARDRAPKNPVYHYHLGLAYVKSGERDRARTALTHALQLRPDFAGAEDARAQLVSLADTVTPAK